MADDVSSRLALLQQIVELAFLDIVCETGPELITRACYATHSKSVRRDVELAASASIVARVQSRHAGYTLGFARHSRFDVRPGSADLAPGCPK